MTFETGKRRTAYLYETKIENLFIGEYMAEIPGDYVKVYLYGLMLAENGFNRTDKHIGEALLLSEDDVKKAFEYLKELGLVETTGEKRTFVSMREKLYGAPEDEEKAAASGNLAAKDGATQPAYRKLLDNESIAKMIQDIQNTLGRFLKRQEEENIMAWLTDYSVEPEVISKAYAYAKGKGKDNYRYIGKIVENWAKQSIRTKRDVEEYLSEVDEKFYIYKRVMKALGFPRRATEEERRIINSWVDELNCNMEDILQACSKTTGIANPNINYVNAVIRGKKGLTEKGVSRSTILAYYEKLREDAARDAARSRAEIFGRIPQLKSIEEQLNESGKDLAMALVQGNAGKVEKIQSIKANVENLEKKKATLLTENNIPIDYLEEKYLCNKCKDTGVLDSGEQCECYPQRAKEAQQWKESGASN